MIYKIESEKLKEIKQKDFKLEKHLQSLVEKNIATLFGLKFLMTEFPVESYRFDTVAFDEESKSFIIIEYKRGKNDSLVDQGYAYLYTLLKRKADFVLLYNEQGKESKSIKDFDWSQTRILFISPEFTSYQKNASSFTNMPFDLYEIRQYEEGIIDVEKINKFGSESGVINPVIDTIVDKKRLPIIDEIKIYKEEDHLKNVSDDIKELYEELKQSILDLSGVEIDVKKYYIAFKGKRNITDLELNKKKIKVNINLKKGELIDNLNITEDISNIGHWGNGDYKVEFDNIDKLEPLMDLIKQSWKKNK